MQLFLTRYTSKVKTERLQRETKLPESAFVSQNRTVEEVELSLHRFQDSGPAQECRVQIINYGQDGSLPLLPGDEHSPGPREAHDVAPLVAPWVLTDELKDV